jgi:two-component system chemotaxis response regulator CheY
MRKMIMHTLESSGKYKCREAIDAIQGLTFSKEQAFDLILTDYNMPVMNGLDFTAALRALPQYRFTPILLLTTETSDTLRQAAKSHGATGWMVKPFNPEKLLQTLDKVLPH